MTESEGLVKSDICDMEVNVFSIGEIKFKTIKDDKGELWIYGNQMARYLGYADTNASIRNNVSIINKNTYSGLIKKSRPIGKRIPETTMFINKEGVKELAIKSKKDKSVELCKHLGIKVHDNKYTSKESDTIKAILKVFKNEEYYRQKAIGKGDGNNYYIDLYFPLINLAVECDENGHKHYDMREESSREEYIKTMLGCDFYRYNPDEDGFDILDVISDIKSKFDNKRKCDYRIASMKIEHMRELMAEKEKHITLQKELIDRMGFY